MGFDSFLGNPQAVAAIREMLASGRLPGALLFSGPEGVGKKTLAIMLAKALVCERGGGDFCGECARCRKADQMLTAAREDLSRRREIKESARRVEGLIYFDLQIIEPITKFILAEQIRQLRAIAYTRPFEFPRRVFIVDEAQTIHWQAVDLLLKVLEEPPETTSFILICPNAFELRPTIRSRCTRVGFQPVSESIIQDLLAGVKKFTTPQRELAARVAAGSIARARSFDPAEYERHRQPWVDYLAALADGGGTGSGTNLRQAFDSARAIAENRADLEGTLGVGYSLLSDLMRLLLNPAADTVVNIDLAARINSWAAKLGLEKISRLKAGLDEAYRLQIRNVNPQLGFETLAIEVNSIRDPSSA
jgi:DNA polymerase III subunit delta'